MELVSERSANEKTDDVEQRATSANDTYSISVANLLQKSGNDTNIKGFNTNRTSSSNPDIRYQIIGETGATALDKAEESTHRLDNLAIAREMEGVIEEKKARIEKLKASKPVEITGEEIELSDDLKQYKANALEYSKGMRGEYINADTGAKILLSKGTRNGGYKEFLQHDLTDINHIKSVAAIPQIIEESIFIDSLPNSDKAKNPLIDHYDYYVCGLKIGGVDFTVRAVVVEESNGNRYYDHKLTQIEKTKLIDYVNQSVKNSALSELSSTVAHGVIDNEKSGNQSEGNKTSTPISYYKDRRLISILQIPDVKSIRLATGWEKGVDGLWRYEKNAA